MKPEKQLVIRGEHFKQSMAELADLIWRGLRSGEVVVTLGRKKRSNDQNAKMWPMLTDISRHVLLEGNKYKPEQWKVILIKHWSNQSGVGVELLPEYGGGGLFYAASSSKLNKRQFSELIEVLYQVGAEEKVPWSEPALKTYKQYGLGGSNGN
ncbi:recombination protein [Oceanospirillum phage vB_OliS_GJ44]|nr:recombination protein [Oceanospirillum phage vB_OliS_GJ44]